MVARPNRAAPPPQLGRGGIIEGQVWSLRGAEPPLEAEVLKTFNTWDRPWQEPVLLLPWSLEPPMPALADKISETVFQVFRRDLKENWELVSDPLHAGPVTSLQDPMSEPSQ